MKIRLATPDDAAVLRAIYAPYVEKTAVSFEWTVPSVEEFRRRIEQTLTQYPYFVAEEDGKPVGYAYAGMFHSRESYRHGAEVSIYVAENEHHKGIGKALYQALETALLSQNIYTVYACVAKTDDPADLYLTDASIVFHKAMGYIVTGLHRDCGYKFDRWYSIVWMEKELAKKPHSVEPFIPYSF